MGLLTGAHAFAAGPKNLRTRDGTDLLKAYAELRLSRHGQDHHRRFCGRLLCGGPNSVIEADTSTRTT